MSHVSYKKCHIACYNLLYPLSHLTSRLMSNINFDKSLYYLVKFKDIERYLCHDFQPAYLLGELPLIFRSRYL